jgi:hypothetical protein
VAGSPLLSQIRSEASESIPTSRVSDGTGRELEIPPAEEVVELSVDYAPVVEGNLSALLAALDAAAEMQERAMAATLFSGITQITEYTGNQVDAGGRPISWDLITDGLEKMEISFDENDQMDLTIVMHPDTLKKLEDLGPPTPEQEARHNAVMAVKLEEWKARKRQRRLR